MACRDIRQERFSFEDVGFKTYLDAHAGLIDRNRANVVMTTNLGDGQRCSWPGGGDHLNHRAAAHSTKVLGWTDTGRDMILVEIANRLADAGAGW